MCFHHVLILIFDVGISGHEWSKLFSMQFIIVSYWVYHMSCRIWPYVCWWNIYQSCFKWLYMIILCYFKKDWLWVIVAVAEWCINIVVFISLEDCGYFYRFYRRCQVQFWSGRAWLYPLWRSHLHRRCPRFMERCRICQDSVQLVNTTPISLWFMALITFYNYSFWGL